VGKIDRREEMSEVKCSKIMKRIVVERRKKKTGDFKENNKRSRRDHTTHPHPQPHPQRIYTYIYT
jgi:hypothetical protein